MSLNKFFIFTIVILLLKHTSSDQIRNLQSSNPDILPPQKLRSYMFKTQITGKVNVMVPTKQKTYYRRDHSCQNIQDSYDIQMIKTTQQILPKGVYNATPIYAYAGQTNNGYKASFPGPAIIATKDKPVKVTWRNNIPGPHILPVDLSFPFMNSTAFQKQVPTVVHAHGVAVKTSSDGEPEAYYTKSGFHSPDYATEQPCAKNQAVFIYPNQQQAGNNWFHDHAFGITRLNVYAGLAGLYKIVDPQSKQEADVVKRYGSSVSENQTKFLIVTDKTFKNNGSLFYPEQSMNPQFTSWVPQFFGNTMLVNGVLWPLMKLTKGKYRFVLLNACQSRFLKLSFVNSGTAIPFNLIRIDNDYFQNPVSVTQYLFTISSRIQFIIDFSNISGQITLKNTASAPYPVGDAVNQFTGQIMKFKVASASYQLRTNQKCYQKSKQELSIDCNKKPERYPTFSEGQKVFATLLQIRTPVTDLVISAFIDGVSMESGGCVNSTYKIGKTYDFYFVNLTPDAHPIHFHLINMQKVKQYKFNVTKYSDEYFRINGDLGIQGFASAPTNLDPEFARLGDDEPAKPEQRVFRDTIDALPQYVTVMRIKFAKNDGSNFRTFNLRNQRYVFHCHILEHQDNQMMKYYCLK